MHTKSVREVSEGKRANMRNARANVRGGNAGKRETGTE